VKSDTISDLYGVWEIEVVKWGDEGRGAEGTKVGEQRGRIGKDRMAKGRGAKFVGFSIS